MLVSLLARAFLVFSLVFLVFFLMFFHRWFFIVFSLPVLNHLRYITVFSFVAFRPVLDACFYTNLCLNPRCFYPSMLLCNCDFTPRSLTHTHTHTEANFYTSKLSHQLASCTVFQCHFVPSFFWGQCILYRGYSRGHWVPESFLGICHQIDKSFRALGEAISYNWDSLDFLGMLGIKWFSQSRLLAEWLASVPCIMLPVFTPFCSSPLTYQRGSWKFWESWADPRLKAISQVLCVEVLIRFPTRGVSCWET